MEPNKVETFENFEIRIYRCAMGTIFLFLPLSLSIENCPWHIRMRHTHIGSRWDAVLGCRTLARRGAMHPLICYHGPHWDCQIRIYKEGTPSLIIWLVIWNIFTFPLILGMEKSSQLTNTPSFFRGVGLAQPPSSHGFHGPQQFTVVTIRGLVM